MSTDVECGGNHSLEIYDQQGNPLTPTPLKIDLRNAAAIRRELGSVYRDMRAGRIDPADGTKLAYVLDAIRKAYEAEVLAARLEILERTLRK